MYLDYFRFDREPFSISPDPSFLYLSAGHDEALAHLQYGLSHGGFVLVTGEVGTGKTMLLRNLARLTPENMDLVFILNPRLTAKELLETICDELNIRAEGEGNASIKNYVDQLTTYLLRANEQGRTTLLVIDEAQNLSPAVLEQIRLLTNLETDSRKLLRIILIGQPELDAMLARRELRQLSQRITARYHLGPLTRAETSAYIAHRLAKAGGDPELFTPAAQSALFRLTMGIPRLINVVADRALLGAFAHRQRQVDARLVRTAARELHVGINRTWNAWWSLAIALVLLLALAALWVFWPAQDPQRTAARQPDPIPAAEAAPEVAEPAFDSDASAPVQAPAPDTASAPVEPPTLADAPLVRPDQSRYQLQRHAFHDVLARWGANYPIDAAPAPCEFSPTQDLLCSARNGTLADIEALDLPVVLEMWDDQPEPWYAALLEMQNSTLLIGVAGEPRSVTMRQLRDKWFGNYTVVWPRPQLYRGNLKPGDISDSVTILRDLLEEASGKTLPFTIINLFDENLAAALADFQTREGLTPDNVAGPITWVHLFRRTRERSMPTLVPAVEAR
ncbi:MAG: AAA family ATPase [Pseudomonadales bacterium]